MNEVYVNYGLYRDGWRRWEDATQYSFLCAGGGRNFSDLLRTIKEDDRLWIYVPAYGYAGVALAAGQVQSADLFRVRGSPITSVLGGPYANDRKYPNDPDRREYFLPVRWLQWVDLDHAVGYGCCYFSNPRIVCRPEDERWSKTLNLLRKSFPDYSQH